ncbi:MAG TPA: NAD(P)-dependent oxidoreductase [Solirubrobacteraceae bacterium]|nr:NAD(P)-dependent oxidoreductase [Solirubrobacteraceae bacterium]
MTRVLVTGASGFVGWPLIAELVQNGDEVHAVSSREPPAEPDGVHWHRADLAGEGAADALIDELAPERLIHLAWFVEHGRFWSAPENVLWVERSLRLLRAFARAGGKRAVMLGTSAEYDWSAASEPLRELDSPLVPVTMYGVAKDALRRVCDAYAELERLELAWGRLFFLYGPREQPGRLVAAVIRSLLAGERVDVSSGEQLRDFLHVEDVARALVALLASSVCGPVNIASGCATPVAEMLDQIGALIGRPELIVRGGLADRREEPPLLVADVTRLREEVGFHPRWELAYGLADTVRWWEQQEKAVGKRR